MSFANRFIFVGSALLISWILVNGVITLLLNKDLVPPIARPPQIRPQIPKLYPLTSDTYFFPGIAIKNSNTVFPSDLGAERIAQKCELMGGGGGGECIAFDDLGSLWLRCDRFGNSLAVLKDEIASKGLYFIANDDERFQELCGRIEGNPALGLNQYGFRGVCFPPADSQKLQSTLDSIKLDDYWYNPENEKSQ